MSSHAARDSVLYGAAVNLLRFNATLAYALPEPNERWTRDDVGDLVERNRRKLQHHGIIHVVEDRQHRADGKHLYRTDRGAYEYTHTHLDEPRTLPCGHAGFRNVEGGEYGCQDDDCLAEYDRATVEEVFFA